MKAREERDAELQREQAEYHQLQVSFPCLLFPQGFRDKTTEVAVFFAF